MKKKGKPLVGKEERLAWKDRKFENVVVKVDLNVSIEPSVVYGNRGLFYYLLVIALKCCSCFSALKISLKIYRRVSMSTADSLVFAGFILLKSMG